MAQIRNKAILHGLKKLNCRKIYIISFFFIFCTFVNYKYKILVFNVNNHEKTNDFFTIMTYNINASNTQIDSSYIERLLYEVKRQNPDILCFQELSSENYGEIRPKLDSIYGHCDSLSKGNQVWRFMFYSAYPLRNYRRYHCEGKLDTTDFDFVEKREYEQMQKQMQVMSAEFEVKPGKWITVFSGHLRSSAYSTARRSMDKDDSWFGGIPLYYRNYEIGKRIRDYEARNVRRFVDEARVEGKRVIVAGDLNDWCGSDCLETLQGTKESKDELKDAWCEGGNGFGFTYDGWHLRLRLDHILYSKEFELVDVKVIDSNLSDHRPLVAKFRVK